MLANHERIAISFPTGNDPLGIVDTDFLCSDGELSQSVCGSQSERNRPVPLPKDRSEAKHGLGKRMGTDGMQLPILDSGGWQFPCFMDEGVRRVLRRPRKGDALRLLISNRLIAEAHYQQPDAA
jgi:hypothetical protein